MNVYKICLLTACLTIGLNVDASDQLAEQLDSCQKINADSDRLLCYDNINKNSNTAVLASEDQLRHNNEFPVLIADLNEPNLFFSFGSLDFLADSARSVLLGVGRRHSIRNFEFGDDHSLTFNLTGLIRSQFDVNELNTRNNRGGALINTDFMIGGELVQSLDHWNWRFSYTHKSTHLGDEFLIDNPELLATRINLSYETIRWDAHKNIKNWDLYAGLGFVTRSEPGDLDKFMWQAGWQFQGNRWQNIRPIWAVDLTSWGAYDWNINVNMRAGIEIYQLTETPFQLLLEYQDGHSPYGQFFTDDLTFSGITLLKNW